MILDLVPVPDFVRSHYRKDKSGPLPRRIAWGHPDLVAALVRCYEDGFRLVVSDCWRSAESSRARRAEFEARGGPQLAKRPGESPHFFGLAIDIDYSLALLETKLTKPQLDAELSARGLWCHRRDGFAGAEAWHYNALGAGDAAKPWLAAASPRSTSRAVEARVLALYGKAFALSTVEVARALAFLGYVSGGGTATPGALKPAIKDFQDDWGLDADGIAGPKTQRLLACLTATHKGGPLPR